MASAHMHAQVISRGSGHSAVAKAAYNARAVLECDRYGATHDYSRHGSKCLFDGIYAPAKAPDWTRDRAQLWNHVEVFEKHRAAELAREVEISLPHELTLEQNRWLLQDWIKENITRKGLIADAAIHAPDARGDSRNVHAHVMIVMRKLDGSEFIKKKDQYGTWSEKQAAKEADLMAMRQSWEKLANKHLERHGHEARIDMGRKLDGEPTVHLGKDAATMERAGRASELGNHNRDVGERNRAPANQNDRDRANWVELKKAEAEVSTLAELVQQQQQRDNAAARARAELDAEAGPQHREARPVIDSPEFTSVLDTMREREARERGDDSDRQARRAVEELARIDPIGTARNFGHQIGGGRTAAELAADRKQTEARDLPAADPTPEPVRQRGQVKPPQEPARERERVLDPVTQPKREKPAQQPKIERRGLFGWLRDLFTRSRQLEAPLDRAADQQQDHAGADRRQQHVNMPAKQPEPQPVQQQAREPEPPAARPVERAKRRLWDEMTSEAEARLADARARETPEQRAEREKQEAERLRGRGDGSRERTRHHHRPLWELLHRFHLDPGTRHHKP